jgi:hypothetical protein
LSVCPSERESLNKLKLGTEKPKIGFWVYDMFYRPIGNYKKMGRET